MLRYFYSIILWLVAFIPASLGNNIQISNVRLVGSNKITFHISWDNSWKLENLAPPYNHDAAWIFIKYRPSGGDWDHVTLYNDTSQHISSDSLMLETVADGKGIFVKRKYSGSGTVSGTVTLKWVGYVASPGKYDYRVFGIEMVRVNEGPYFLGDAASYKHLRRGDADLPYYIRSENTITAGHDSLSLNDTGEYAPVAAIPATYPKGYNGFYCMKYELSQEQYTAFLNTLTYIQQKGRVNTSSDPAAGSYAFGASYVNRNGIAIESPGTNNTRPAIFACQAVADNIFNNNDDGQNRACNFLSWADVAAYLDWAALRPMTELEFEKACRGPVKPLKREFAWGTALSVDANTLSDDGTDNEHVSDSLKAGAGLASYGYSGPQGPIRGGFAANDTTSRISAGAAYYGIMELSGNLWEPCITVDSKGLLFQAKTGDGRLDANGNADTDTWPGTDAIGAGCRGGAWNSGVFQTFRDPAISDRYYAGLQLNFRRNTSGGRGVR